MILCFPPPLGFPGSGGSRGNPGFPGNPGQRGVPGFPGSPGTAGQKGLFCILGLFLKTLLPERNSDCGLECQIKSCKDFWHNTGDGSVDHQAGDIWGISFSFTY